MAKLPMLFQLGIIGCIAEISFLRARFGEADDGCSFLKDRVRRIGSNGHDKKRLDGIRQELNLAQNSCPAFMEGNGERSRLPCTQVLFSLKDKLGQR